VADTPETETKTETETIEEAPDVTRSGMTRWIVLLVVLIGVGVLVHLSRGYLTETAGSRGEQGRPLVAVPAIGGPFTLTDHNGKQVTEKDFHGKNMLVFFGYTFCPDVCPTTLTDISEAMEKLGDDANKVTPVFITIDPARDTPEYLKEYVEHFDPRMVALTGTPEQITAVAKAYRVYFAKAAQEKGADADDYLMDHSSVSYLMGPDGAFKIHFSHGTKPDILAQRIRENL